MSERNGRGNMVRLVSGILALAMLAALVLALPASSRAQVQGPGSNSARATHFAPKGASEGIRVHGHWTIEVHNPDGKLVKHVEFENSLDPGFSLGMTDGDVPVPGGAALLNALLDGQAQPAPNAWGIFLLGSSSLATLGTGSNGPCASTLNVYAPVTILNNTNNEPQSANINGCVLFPPTTGSPDYGENIGGMSTMVFSNPCPMAGISCNVASTSVGTAPNLTGFQLTGSVTATQTGQIATVATVNYAPCGGLTPGAGSCQLSTASLYYTNFQSQKYYLNMVSFTSSSNFSGAPISVLTGQTVTATVTISFQ